MKAFRSNVFLFRILGCLLSLQLCFFLPASAQEASLSQLKADAKTSSITTNGPELEKMLDLFVRIMKHQTLYKFINETLANATQTPTHKSTGTVKINKITQSKLIYLLSKTKAYWKDIEDYLKEVPEDKVNEPDIQIIREKYKEIFEQILRDKKLLKYLTDNASVFQPLRIVDSRSKISYKDMSFYANHPRNEKNNQGEKVLIPADDHKKIMIDFVKSAQSGDRLYINAYDFDLEELADAIIAAKNRGVEVIIGIDKNVVETKAAAKLVYEKLIAAGVNVELVDSTGLNHQKMFALISKYGRSKILLSSGNLTQSCSGPEGDLKQVPADQRPSNSIPNPNNMIIVKGDIPAAIAAAEIRKNLVYKLRGQTEFPIGGAYELRGPHRPDYKDRDWMIMAFSPNGGLGDINRDIYAPIIKSSSGPIYGAFFSLSSETLAHELTQKIVEEIKVRRRTNKPVTDLIKFVGDTRFAMRDFSVLLRLSGFRLVEYDAQAPFDPVSNTPPKDPEEFEKPTKKELVKVYIEDPSDPISKPIRDLLTKKEWENFRQNIRINVNWFNETEFEYEGKKLVSEVKLHDKLFAFLTNFLSNPGSSGNFSTASKANQEQMALVYSEHITKKVIATIESIFDTFSEQNLSVTAEAKRRNQNNSVEEIKLGSKVLEFRKKQEQEKQKSQRNLQDLTCPMIFAN